LEGFEVKLQVLQSLELIEILVNMNQTFKNGQLFKTTWNLLIQADENIYSTLKTLPKLCKAFCQPKQERRL
jgi:hypothetical protein